MNWRPVAAALCLTVVAGAAVASAAGSSEWGQTARASRCPIGTKGAVIAGVQTCLKVGQRCKVALNAQYRRYGFTCVGGRLRRASVPRIVGLSVTLSAQPVFTWRTQRCEDLDIPDLSARAFRDAGGDVQLIAAHFINRRVRGTDFNHLRHECPVILQSDLNPDPAAFDDHEWIASTWTPDGTTVYALVHDEYQGNTHPGRCPSGIYENCWWNTITLAVSRDAGRTYVDQSPPRLVASVPYTYVPDAGTYGAMMPTNIVQNPRDGYFYAVVYVKRQPVGQPANNGECLMRTKTLDDPSSWRAWSGGTNFDTTFVDPYGQNADPTSHLCTYVSPGALGDCPPGSLTYVTRTKQWLFVCVSDGGFYYSVSPDLSNWSNRKLFYAAPVPWTYKSGDPEPVHYPSLIDPTSTSRNFDTAGRTAFLYFTQFHPRFGGLDRDLVRVPVTITVR